MNDVEKARCALKEIVALLRRVSEQHGSLRVADPGWDLRLSYALSLEALSSLQKWINDRDRLNSHKVTLFKSVN